MATIVTRAGKGAALTHQEVDANFTGLNTELGQKEVASNKGVANGYASLDAAGKVPSAQLPSYVDDVVEVANFASLPGTGETGKIYVTIDTNKTYRWTGSTYIEISASPGSTDSLAEGSTNLYFTQARARASLSASGSLSYNSSTGVISFTDAVTFVAGRTGAVTLTSSDVGLGSVENKSSATIRGELTSGNVTTALGYTPYNATNPSGYITSSASITGSAGSLSDTTNYFVNRGSVAAASIDSAIGLGVWSQSNVGDSHTLIVAGAGGSTSTVQQRFHYTGSMEFRNRTDSTNWQSWKTVLSNANYNSYSPTLTGTGASGTWGISVTGTASSISGYNNPTTAATANTIVYRDSGGDIYGRYHFGVHFNQSSSNTENPSIAAFWTNSGSDNYNRKSSPAHVISQLGLLTTSNYSSYALPLSGGTLTGTLTGTTGRFQKNQTAGDYTTAALWTESYGSTATGIAFHISGNVGKFLEMRTNGLLYFNSDLLLHSGNYTSYSPSLTGSGASGTWGISISGSAAQLNGRSVNQIFNNMGQSHGTYTSFNNIPEFGAYYVQGSANGPGTGSEQFYGFTLGLGNEYAYSSYALQIAIPRYNYGTEGGGPDRYISIRSREGGGWNAWQKIRAGYADSAGSVSGGLTTSNYNSYAPTLTGGGASGTWGINVTGSAGSVSWANISAGVRSEYGNLQFQPGVSSFSGMRFLDTSGNGAGWFLIRGTSDTDVYTAEGITLVADKGWLTLAQRETAGRGVRIMSGTTSTERIKVTATGDIQLVNGNSFTYNSSAVLHAGNYSSYALPLSGGAMTGNISGPAYNSPNFIRFASDNNWTYGCSYDGGSQYWMQVQFYGTGDDTRGFRVLDKNGDAVRFRVNGAGNVTASGNVTAYSDERVKANWRQLDDGFVVKLAGVKSGIYDRTDIELTQAGVSAQSLRDVLPQTVMELSDGELSVAYGNAALVSAVELAKELVALKQEVAELRARVH